MLKCAVVGVGYLGQYHAEKYAKNKQAELVAVVDPDLDRSKTIARKYKTRALIDYRELPLLGVKCASVVTPTLGHYEIASWLLRHGIDVLVEKPMCATVEQARSLVEIAQETGRILQVGHLERFNPAFKAMKRMLTRPGFFEVRRITPYSGRGTDVDVVLDLMIHDIDIVSHLVGRPVEKIDATGIPILSKQADIANARLTFAGGTVANITASRVALKSERTVRIFQPEVYISLDYETKKLKIYTRARSLSTPSSLFTGISVEEHKVELRDALEDEIASFITSVLSQTKPEVSGEDGYRALELATVIQQTITQNIQRYYSDVKDEILSA